MMIRQCSGDSEDYWQNTSKFLSLTRFFLALFVKWVSTVLTLVR